MPRISLVASRGHYLAHMLPVWRALPESVRGDVYLDGSLFGALPGAAPLTEAGRGSGPVLIAGGEDLDRAGARPVVLMEHGVGQSYRAIEAARESRSYAGGNRPGVILFLCPNEYAAAANRERAPQVPSVVIGSPRVADLQRIAPPPVVKGKLTVALAFHWDCSLGDPESGTAFNYWVAGEFGGIATDPGFEVLGHGHPRSFADYRPHYERLGIEPVGSFEEILERAHVLVADNTSVMYEFAALRGPVVVVNSPEYRMDVDHGLRFWDCAAIGPQISEPAAVSVAVRDAWKTRPWPGAAEILDRVFPPVEDPARAGAEAIVSVLDGALTATPV